MLIASVSPSVSDAESVPDMAVFSVVVTAPLLAMGIALLPPLPDPLLPDPPLPDPLLPDPLLLPEPLLLEVLLLPPPPQAANARSRIRDKPKHTTRLPTYMAITL